MPWPGCCSFTAGIRRIDMNFVGNSWGVHYIRNASYREGSLIGVTVIVLSVRSFLLLFVIRLVGSKEGKPDRWLLMLL